MIKGILQKLIREKLGKFIKNLTSQQLQTDLFGGEVTMTNIELNEEYFNELLKDTFIQFDFSSVGKLFIQAPLTKLSTVPVTLIIEDVFMLLKTKNLESFVSKKKSIVNEKEKLLVSYIKKLFEKMMQNIKDKEDQGYLAKIMNKIIDNLTIKVSNVHVRIENVTNSTSQSYSTGITIEELSLQTTDEKWQVKFVDRYEENQNSQQAQQQNMLQKVRKLVNIKALNWYWESFHDDKRIISMKNDMKAKYELMKSIFEQGNKQSPKSPKIQLISLTSQAKILINQSNDFKVPLIELSLNLEPISINIQQECLYQMFEFTNKLSRTYVNQNSQPFIEQQKTNLSSQISNPNHKRFLQKLTQQIVQIVNEERQPQNFQEFIVKKLNSSKEISSLVEGYPLDLLLKQSQVQVKKEVLNIKERKMKKQTRGWFSKERQLTEKEKQDLQQLVENTFLQASIKRPKSALFLKLFLRFQKLQIRVINKLNQNIIFELNNILFAMTLSRDMKFCQIAATLTSIQLFYLSEQKIKTFLIKNFGSKEEAKNLIEFQLILQERNKTKSTKIQAEIAKLLVNYEHFLIKKITDFVGSVSKNNTQNLNKLIVANSKNQKMASPQKQQNLIEFKYVFDINCKITSPTILLPVQETEYVDSGNNSKKYKKTKQCWVLDLGCFSVNKIGDTTTHSLELKDISLKHCKTFDLQGETIEQKQCSYSLISGINVAGSVHISNQKQLDLKLAFQEIGLSISYTEYKKILKISQLFTQFLTQQQNTEIQKIISTSVWQGPIRKKQYKIHSGYVYVDYFAIVTPQKLYLFQKQGDFKPKQHIHLKHYHLKSKDNQKMQKSQISSKSSEISQNDGFYTKVQIAHGDKSQVFKVSNTLIHEFQQKLYPLLFLKEKVSLLDEIVEEIEENFVSPNDHEEQVFQEFDDVEDKQEFKSMIRESEEKSEDQSKPKQKITSPQTKSSMFNLIKISFQIQKIMIVYEHDKPDQKSQIESNNKNTKLYEVSIQHIFTQVVIDPIQKQTAFQFAVANLRIRDYVYLYNNPDLQYLITVDGLVVEATHIQAPENYHQLMGSVQIDIDNQQSQQTVQEERFIITLNLNSVIINWKPDVFLALIHFFNSTREQVNRGSMIEHPLVQKKHINQMNVNNFIKQNPQFWQKKTTYDELLKEKIYNKSEIFKPMSKVRLSIDTSLSQIEINFMHRESHLQVFKVLGNSLQAKVGVNKEMIYAQTLLKDLQLIDTTNYPQREYAESEQYRNENFALFGKKSKSEDSNFIQVRFVKHEQQLHVCNNRRVNSAISVEIQPAFFYFFQQPVLRIVDYALVQILTLLTDYDLIQANESLKTQLSRLQKTNIEKERQKFKEEAVFFLFNEYQQILKKLLHPLITDLFVEVKQPEIILKASKQENFQIVLQCEKLQIQNYEKRSPNRVDFQKINPQSFEHLNVYEETYSINLINSVLYTKEGSDDFSKKSELSTKFEGTFSFDKLMNELQLEKLYPTAKLVRDLNCSLKLDPQLKIPQLSRTIYQNLLKIMNFNLAYDDGQDQLFIHNYQISKLRDPNLINFSLVVPRVILSCCYQDPNDENKQIELMDLNVGEFLFHYHRNQILDSSIKINFLNLQIKYPQSLNKKSGSKEVIKMVQQPNQQKKSLLSYFSKNEKSKKDKRPDNVYLEQSKKDGSKVIMINFKDLALFIDMKIINAAQQFFYIEKWTSPVQQDTNSFMKLHCQLQNAQIYVLNNNPTDVQQGFLIKGIVCFQYKSRQVFTFEHVLELFKQKSIDQDNLRQIGQVNNIDFKMWVNFFYYRNEVGKLRQNEHARRILQLAEISFCDSQQYGYVSSSKKKDTKTKEERSKDEVMMVSNIKIHTSELRAKISLSDYLLLEKIANQFSIQQEQSKQIINCFNKNRKSERSHNIDDTLDRVQSQKPKNSPYSSLFIEFGGISLFLYDIKFNPIIQVKMNNFSLFKKSSSMSASINFEGKYFNQQIFVWEPFLEENKLIIIYQESLESSGTNQNSQADLYVQLNLQKDVRINITRELIKSMMNLKAAYNRYSINKVATNLGTPGSSTKIQPDLTPEYNANEEIQFVSHYVIRNETGYPIRIFSSRGKQVSIIMNHDSLPYSFEEGTQKDDEKSLDVLGFQILHQKYELQTLRGVTFDFRQKIKTKLKTVENKFLNDTISLETYCKDSKKVLLIASPKLIKDFTSNTLNEKYLPFDHPNNIQLSEPEKVKASFYDNEINKNIKSKLLYRANNGCLQIKHAMTVFNYTPIPLEISQSFAMPGQFVGIQEPLKIQGIYHEDQKVVKVVHNKEKREYYLYATSYLIDYTGTLQYGFKDDSIMKRFNYETIENKRKITIYLLPSIDYTFYTRWNKEKFMQVDPKLGRQTIQLRKNLQLHQFNVFSYLSNVETTQIKELKKIIEVTQAIYLVNETNYEIMLPQNNYKNQVLHLKKGEKKPFYWQDYSSPKLFQVVPDIAEYGSSNLLGLENNESFLVPHVSKQYKKAKIFSLICQITDNIDFVVIQQCVQSRYEITNTVPNSVMQLFLKQNSKQELILVKYGESLPFGFLNKEMRQSFYLQVDLNDQSQSNQGYTSERIRIQKFENILFEKQIILKPKNSKGPFLTICLELTFENKKKSLKITPEKDKDHKRQTQAKQLEVLVKIPNIFVSLIGNFEYQRREIFVFILEHIGVQIIKTKKAITYSTVLESFRMENLHRKNPYYEVLAYSQLTTSKCFMKFVYSQSLDSPNLIYYLGFSMGHLVVTTTSQEIEVFLDNMNDLLRQKNLAEYEENNFIEISYDKKINPEHLARPNNFLYFVSSQIRPLKVSLTFKNISGWGGIILKTFGNINNCLLQIDGKKINNMLFPNFSTYLKAIENHVIQSIKGQLFSIVGSLTLISAPLNVASKIKTGFENFLTIPAESFENNPLNLGKGVALGTGSLLKNTFEGIFEGAQSLGHMIGNSVSMTITDQDFNKRRAQIKNKKSSNVIEGIGHGVTSIFNGFAGGITGVVTQTAKGAQKKGFGGFGLGLLKGVTGLVTKPLTGIVDGVSKTAEGIKNTTKIFESEEKTKKRNKTYQNRPFYGIQRSIRAYDKVLAYWNSQLQRQYLQQIHSQFSYINFYKASSRYNLSLLIIITPLYTFVANDDTGDIKQMIKNSNVKKVLIDLKTPNKVLITRENEGNVDTLQFTMVDANKTKDIVKDLEGLIRPFESTLYYEKNQ